MKKLFLLFILFFTAFTYGQNAEKIVDDYLKAIGGDKLEEVKSIKQKGHMMMQGMDFPMETYQDTSGKMYTKMNMMGQDIIATAFDGQKGFMFDNATFGYKDIPDSLSQSFKEKAKNMFGYFYKYKDQHHKIKYLGTKKTDSVTYELVQLILNKPMQGVNEVTAYFNPKTHLLDVVEINKDNHIVLTKSTDYKNFGDIKLPTKVTTEVDGNPVVTIKMDEVFINPPAPDASIFKKPE
jgi:hypothetical protein